MGIRGFFDNNGKWKLSRNGVFAIRSCYKGLQGPGPKFPADKWVWGPMSTPKHSFIHWLASKDRLLTAQRMCMMNLNLNSYQCALCNRAADSRDHLFFECPWSKSLMFDIAAWLGMSYMPCSLASLYKWLSKLNKLNEVRWVFSIVHGAAAYHIWLCRCQKFHNSPILKKEQVLAKLQEEISYNVLKFLSRKPKCNSFCLTKYMV